MLKLLVDLIILEQVNKLRNKFSKTLSVVSTYSQQANLFSKLECPEGKQVEAAKTTICIAKRVRITKSAVLLERHQQDDREFIARLWWTWQTQHLSLRRQIWLPIASSLCHQCNLLWAQKGSSVGRTEVAAFRN